VVGGGVQSEMGDLILKEKDQSKFDMARPASRKEILDIRAVVVLRLEMMDRGKKGKNVDKDYRRQRRHDPSRSVSPRA